MPETSPAPLQWEAFREPVLLSWARRLVTLPLYALAFVLVWGLSPVLLAVTLAGDLVRRRGLVLSRCVLMLMAFLLAEMIGVIASMIIWAGGAGWRRHPSPAYLRRNFQLQCWWTRFLFRAGVRIFDLRVSVDGDEALKRGPLVLFVRHASPVDNLIPAAFGSDRHGLRLRWLMNRWLLRDPSIDIVGNRLPNAFVRSGTSDTERFLGAARALAAGLGPHDGVLTYPEGGLFSESRRQRLVERLWASDPTGAERAAQLRHVLPPRLGGSLALIEGAGTADIVFCAHTGLEVAGSYRSLLSGDLIGRDVRISFWRIPRADVPAEGPGRADWLWEQWRRVDEWIATNRESVPDQR